MDKKRRKNRKAGRLDYNGIQYELIGPGGKRRQEIYRPSEQNSESSSASSPSTTRLLLLSSNEINDENLDFGDTNDMQDDSGDEESRHVNNWSIRKERLRNAWNSKAADLIEHFAKLIPFTFDADALCFSCKGEDASYRCHDCGVRLHFCHACIMKKHDYGNFCHRMEHFQVKENMFVPFQIIGKIECCEESICSSVFPKKVTCIDGLGFQHQAIAMFCSCQSEAALLIKNGFWPGTPSSPTIAFSFQFMDYLSSLVLECQVSLRKFCDAIYCKYTALTPLFVQDFYTVLQRGCFLEYRQFHYLVNYGSSDTGFDRGNTCFACPKESGIKVFAADGCFGLVRKKSAGASDDGRRFGNGLFLEDQSIVDQFVDSYYKAGQTKKSKTREGCHNFHAGEEVIDLFSKGKHGKLDETGLFGTVCRHDCPQRFYSCKYGERIAYMVYGLRELLKPIATKNIKPFLLYDIACTLESHLKKTKQHDLLKQVTLAIPGFHIYGHGMSCQIKYSPRRSKGIGLTDGEGAERLWSYLREFSAITKEMTAANREDLLNDALLHFSERKNKKLDILLVAKMMKADSWKKSAQKSLDDLLLSVPSIKIAILDELAEKDRERSIKLSANKNQTPWQELYVKTRVDADNARAVLKNVNITPKDKKNFESKLKKYQKVMADLEKAHLITNPWDRSSDVFISHLDSYQQKEIQNLISSTHALAYDRYIWIQQQKRYSSGGQGIAIKISKCITKVTAKISSMHALLLKKANISISPFVCPSLEDLLNIENQCYRSEPRNDHDTVEICPAIRRELIDHRQMVLRCEEESVICKQEMQSHVEHLRIEIAKLKFFIASNPNSNTSPLVHNQLIRNQYQLARIVPKYMKLAGPFDFIVDKLPSYETEFADECFRDTVESSPVSYEEECIIEEDEIPVYLPIITTNISSLSEDEEEDNESDYSDSEYDELDHY